MPTVAEIEAFALELPEGLRAQLAEALWRSIPDGPEYDVSDEEVQRRRKEMEEDPSSRITLEELQEAVERRIAE
jgi:putative addiction module component (TIGR02574 family)